MHVSSCNHTTVAEDRHNVRLASLDVKSTGKKLYYLRYACAESSNQKQYHKSAAYACFNIKNCFFFPTRDFSVWRDIMG